MLELPTIKTDFSSRTHRNYDQTTHARPQHPIVLIDIISLYFNCTSSVKYVFKRSRHGHIMPFSAVRPKRVAGKVPTRVLDCRLFCSFHFFTFKMAYEGDLECSNE